MADQLKINQSVTNNLVGYPETRDRWLNSSLFVSKTKPSSPPTHTPFKEKPAIPRGRLEGTKVQQEEKVNISKPETHFKLSGLQEVERKQAYVNVILKTHDCGEKGLRNEQGDHDFQLKKENSDCYCSSPVCQ